MRVSVSGVIIVTTGQKAALEVTRRGVTMFKKLNIPILGIVQNMSTMKCSKCSHENHIFGDSVQELARQEGVLSINDSRTWRFIDRCFFRNHHIVFCTSGSNNNRRV